MSPDWIAQADDHLEENRVDFGANPQAGTLWGAEEIKTWDEVVWAESVDDARALRLAGYPQSVCLIRDGKRDIFAPLARHQDGLTALLTVRIAFPAGEKSKALREEIARRLGRHRCMQVEWPDTVGSAVECLEKYGKDGLADQVAAAVPYPIDGLQQLTGEMIVELMEAEPPRVMTTGCRATDVNIALPTEGRLIVVTGTPSAGKSSWMTSVIAHTIRHERRRWAIFSPEMSPWQEYASQIVASLLQCNLRAWMRSDPAVARAEIRQTEAWVRDRTAFLVNDSEKAPPTLDNLLERARIAITRQGITDLLLDPWNELEEQFRPGEREDQFIRRSLQRIKAFATRYGCNIWIVAHPNKPGPGVDKGAYRPTAYDISGGSMWFNKADMILCVHRPAGITEIHLDKSRFAYRWGAKGSVSNLAYNQHTNVFSDALDNLK